ncbi:epimerase [Kineococcus gypseus]|uniref:epimerase n=1 Tax=Kineococcus gypseus TaxID=1637102 RepID=UPI003D7CECFB
MKVVLPGGTGQVGGVLRRALARRGDDVVVLGRRPQRLEDGVRHVLWDGRSPGPWQDEVDGADAVVNLAGRTVNCRYTDANLRQMMDSRVDSARAVGEAVARAARPPRVWLQMSTATIYADARSRGDDLPHDEEDGVLGGEEPGVPLYWEYSVRIARRWERAQAEADTPATRRAVLRTSMVMTPDAGGVFDYLSTMARLGLGGAVAGGEQFVSWIHGDDFVRAVLLLLERDDLDGPFILAAPEPVPQRELMRSLRAAWGVPVGLPATRLMAEVGAFVLRTDTELLLKSRRVVPGRLLAAGFTFEHPRWAAAAQDLAARSREQRRRVRPRAAAGRVRPPADPRAGR